MKFLTNPALVLRALIALAYIGLGGALLLNARALPMLSPVMRIAFAVLLLAYGSFRAYRAWDMFKNDEL